MTPDLLAYLDPATGSVILQAIVGGVAAMAVTVRLWGTRAKEFFLRLTPGGRRRLAQAEQARSNSPTA